MTRVVGEATPPGVLVCCWCGRGADAGEAATATWALVDGAPRASRACPACVRDHLGDIETCCTEV